MVVWAHLVSQAEKPNKRLLKPERELYIESSCVLLCKEQVLGKQGGQEMETSVLT